MVQAALATVRELAHHQPDTLIHADLNLRNILKADREPWLTVDPKGLGPETRPTTAARLTGRSAAPPASSPRPPNSTARFVIFADKIFRYPRKQAEGRQQAQDYARSIGIPESQLDWQD
ncbi:hypothetical protein ACGF7W_32115 [Streptomyces sp. NPDC048219]|uniref:hypothetical protein n=1 Tax=Streptomyces sp. NPDC048219 TaxID=3365517 RepID=UPI0037187C33